MSRRLGDGPTVWATRLFALLAMGGLVAACNSSSGSEVFQVEVDGGTVWASDGEALWATACGDSYPPICVGDIRVVGVDAADLPGAESVGDVTWAEVVRLIGSFDKATGILTVTDATPASTRLPRAPFGPAPCDPIVGSSTYSVSSALTSYLEEQSQTYGGSWISSDGVLVVQFTDVADHEDQIDAIYDFPFCVIEVEMTEAERQAKEAEVFAAVGELRSRGTYVLGVSGMVNNPLIEVRVFLADPDTIELLHDRFGSEMLQITSAATILP